MPQFYTPFRVDDTVDPASLNSRFEEFETALAAAIAAIPASSAPGNATYITRTGAAGLTDEQALGSLESGILHVTTVTGVVTSLKTNFTATGPPAVTDSSGNGYSVGSLWLDTTTGILYFCKDASLGAAVWKRFGTKTAIICDQKTSGTNGGSAAATTQNARDLNTEVYNPDGIVAIASNQFTPVAEVFKIFAIAPGRKVGAHRLKLWNVTQSSEVMTVVSSNASSAGADNTDSHAILTGVFTANGTDAYRIDHYTAGAQATNGLGVAVGNGDPEIYLVVELEMMN